MYQRPCVPRADDGTVVVMQTHLTNTQRIDILTHQQAMRTNIDIDDALMERALRVSGEPTKRAVVERALQLLIDTHGQAGIRALRGAIEWQGDLAASRQGRRLS